MEFNFGNALMHFTRTTGPSGFTWKYIASYAVVAFILLGISFVAMRPLFEFYGEFMSLAFTDPEALEDEAAMAALIEGRLGGMGLSFIFMLVLVLPLALGFWATFEAASQRRYIRRDGFLLRFGGDELRLMVVGLVVYLTFYAVAMASLIPFGIIVAIAGATGSIALTIIGMIVGYIAMLGAMVWYTARMSAASALTIRDRKIKLFESFRVTKGRTWPIIGSMLVIWLVAYIAIMIVYFIGAGLVLAQFADLITGGDDIDAAVAFERLKSPAVTGSIGVALFLLNMVYGFVILATGGPGALAVNNDPENPAALGGTADVFG